jgi:hypothetical protein
MSFEVPNSTSPFWQKPGRYWSLIPVVPYYSHAEYKELKKTAVKEYKLLIRDFMGRESGWLNKDENSEVTLHLASIGVSWEVKHKLGIDGTEIFLRLTKGMGVEWCELVNSFLVTTLDTALRAYVFCQTQFPVYGFDGAVQEICSYLQDEAEFFIENRNLNPMGYHSFHYTNFKFYRSQDESQDLSVTDSDQYEMPMAQFQNIMAAFSMGTHARLGDGSCVRMLDTKLLRLVFKFDIFN